MPEEKEDDGLGTFLAVFLGIVAAAIFLAVLASQVQLQVQVYPPGTYGRGVSK